MIKITSNELRRIIMTKACLVKIATSLIWKLCLIVSVQYSLYAIELHQNTTKFLPSQLEEFIYDEPEVNADIKMSSNSILRSVEEQFYKDQKNLQKAKYQLINGRPDKAVLFLSNIDDYNSKLKLIKWRYLAIIYFIQGEYQKSNESIEKVLSVKNNAWEHFCILKFTNHLALQEFSKVNESFNRCLSINKTKVKNDFFLIEKTKQAFNRQFSQIKKQMLIDIERETDNFEMLRIWAKTSLFLNQEDEFLSKISIIPTESLRENKLREILAMIYARRGEWTKSISMIDDLESVNAFNLKGIYLLKNKELESAFLTFKQTLKLKFNSQNALYYSIPLSISLERPDETLSYLSQLKVQNNNLLKRNSLTLYSFIKLNEIDRARQLLNQMQDRYQFQMPFELAIIQSHLEISLNSPQIHLGEKYRDRWTDIFSYACKNADGFNCYLYGMNLSHDSLANDMAQKKEINKFKNFQIEDLKKASDLKITPLIEDKILDQKDIDELDDKEGWLIN